MDNFFLAAVSQKVGGGVRISLVERGDNRASKDRRTFDVQFEYRGSVIYASIDSGFSRESLSEYTAMVVRKAMAEYDMFCESKFSNDSQKFIESALRAKHGSALDKLITGSAYTLYARELSACAQEASRPGPFDFEIAYRACLESFAECALERHKAKAESEFKAFKDTVKSICL